MHCSVQHVHCTSHQSHQRPKYPCCSCSSVVVSSGPPSALCQVAPRCTCCTFLCVGSCGQWGCVWSSFDSLNLTCLLYLLFCSCLSCIVRLWCVSSPKCVVWSCVGLRSIVSSVAHCISRCIRLYSRCFCFCFYHNNEGGPILSYPNSNSSAR